MAAAKKPNQRQKPRRPQHRSRRAAWETLRAAAREPNHRHKPRVPQHRPRRVAGEARRAAASDPNHRQRSLPKNHGFQTKRHRPQHPAELGRPQLRLLHCSSTTTNFEPKVTSPKTTAGDLLSGHFASIFVYMQHKPDANKPHQLLDELGATKVRQGNDKKQRQTLNHEFCFQA